VKLTLAQRQVKEGIDAVIVDSVLAIRKGLTKDEGIMGLEKAIETIVDDQGELTTGET